MSFRESGVLVSLLFLVFSVTGPVLADQGSGINEKCIMCHADSWNKWLGQKYLHQPFERKECAICHLPNGASGMSASATETPSIKTGELVNQAPIWTKRTVEQGGSGKSTDHVVVLSGLEKDSLYRFRIVSNPKGSSLDEATDLSQWLGLLPSKLAIAGPKTVSGLDQKTNGKVTSLKILKEGDDSIFISWQTPKRTFSWLELERLNANGSSGQTLDLHQTAVTPTEQTENHPSLRDQEDLCITVCYSCHPEADLGTSHPVRVYSSRQTPIPSDLPTINGMITCVTCHDPHGAPGDKLVRETVRTKLCVACHVKFKNTSKSTMF